MCFCIFSAKPLYKYKELLNFHKPLLLDISLGLDNQKIIGEWFLAKAVRTSVLFTVSSNA